MDRYHTIHLSGVLPGWYLLIINFNHNQTTGSLIVTWDNCVVFICHLLVHTDSTLWHHVIRLSRSVLLDESNPGFQQRCLIWIKLNVTLKS